jgi:hypothetical protein
VSAANEGVDVIVRFHSLGRIEELRRAVFSIVGQDLRPIRILLVLQRFSDADAAAVRAALAPLLALPDPPTLEILRYDAQEPVDARSALMNLGFAATTARHVALLDYDDVLYPEAYRLLSDRLRDSGAAIAFGQIGVTLVDVYAGFFHSYAHRHPFPGDSLIDLFKQNFCPIHSFMVDRTRVPPDELRFEPTLTIEEDYEFLLRVCSQVTSDFALVHTPVGEYYFKSDDSNTAAGRNCLPPEVMARIEAATRFNDGRRRLAMLSPVVQHQLGIQPYRPGLTIHRFLVERPT